jgi:HD-GYP domain-containing protein (c-di-GMP phosphodiesterase class II)
MYIRSEDDIPYRQYLEENIQNAYNPDSAKSLDIRAEIIQGFQQAATEDYMDATLDQMSYEHLRSSTQRFCEFLESNPGGLKAVLKLKNTEQDIVHHGVSVAALAVSMALDLQLKEGLLLNHLALGCLLHDVEHYHSPTPVSHSMTGMTPEKLEEYKNHPLLGAKRFQEATFVDPLVISIISQHEELSDGTGFPKGLHQAEMDPLVMVAGVANAYDRLIAFEKMDPKDALKLLLIDKMGTYPLKYLQSLQKLLKESGGA